MSAPTKLEFAIERILREAAYQIARAVREDVASGVAADIRSRAVDSPAMSSMPRKAPRKVQPLRTAVAKLEREHIQRALSENDHSVMYAARALGVPVTTLKYKLKRYRLR